MKKTIEIIKKIGGILLLPLWLIFVIGDRIIVAVLFWKESVSYRSYLKQHHMIMAFYRYGGILAILGIVYLLKLAINAF